MAKKKRNNKNTLTTFDHVFYIHLLLFVVGFSMFVYSITYTAPLIFFPTNLVENLNDVSLNYSKFFIIVLVVLLITIAATVCTQIFLFDRKFNYLSLTSSIVMGLFVTTLLYLFTLTYSATMTSALYSIEGEDYTYKNPYEIIERYNYINDNPYDQIYLDEGLVMSSEDTRQRYLAAYEVEYNNAYQSRSIILMSLGIASIATSIVLDYNSKPKRRKK